MKFAKRVWPLGLAFAVSILLASATAFSDEIVVKGKLPTNAVIVPVPMAPVGYHPWYGMGYRPWYMGGGMYGGPGYYQPYGAYGISPYMARVAYLDNRAYLKCIKSKAKGGDKNVVVDVRSAMICEDQTITVKVDVNEE